MAKHSLQVAAEENGYTTRSYSGRGMMGRPCLGVILTNDLGVFFSDVLMHCLGYEDSDTKPVKVEEVAAAMRRLTTDRLGHDTIVYFPGVAFTGENEDEEEDDDEDHDCEGPHCCSEG